MGWLKDRQQNKKDIKLARIQSRTDKAEMRNQTKQTAYEHGIDPKKAITDMVSSLGQSAGSTLSAVYGGGLSPNASSEQLNAVYGGKSGGNILIYVVLGLFAFMMFKK